MSYFDRYSNFTNNGQSKPLPGITIPESQGDKYAVYNKSVTRLDKLSDLYYNNAYSGWLILLANPEYGGLEFNIPDKTVLRVPFPYDSALARYSTQVRIYLDLYGG